MTALSVIRPFIMPEVPNCPVPLIDRAILTTVRDLCEKAELWKETRADVDMTDGEAEIAITVDSAAEIVSVEYVQFNGLELCQTTERELSTWDASWRTTEGDPTHVFTVLRDSVLRLYPIPNRTVADAIGYEVIVKPAMTATSIADFLYEQHIETIRNGALYELLRMANQPWSNPETAIFYRNQYRYGMQEARFKAMTMDASQFLSVTPYTLA